MVCLGYVESHIVPQTPHNLFRSAAARVSAFCDPPDAVDQFCGLESFLDEHGFDAGVQARVVLRVEVAP